MKIRHLILPSTRWLKPARPATAGLALAGLALAALLAGGCSYHYNQGVALEQQNRWEEAAIEYHLALVDDPGDEEIQQAVERSNKVVARENFELYKTYLEQKAYTKAYNRLLDAARQDPAFEPAAEEGRKWMRVLVAGEVNLNFQRLPEFVNLADEIELVALINSPMGESIEAPINITNGSFFAETLLYNPSQTMMTYFNLRGVGVKLVYGRSERRRFTSTHYQMLVDYRTPKVGEVQGFPEVSGEGELVPVMEERKKLAESKPLRTQPAVADPSYNLSLKGLQVRATSRSGETLYTPRFIYLNLKGMRASLDFGRYQLFQNETTKSWEIGRLPIGEKDHFNTLSRNIALQPYFYYHGEAIEFVNSL